MIVPTILEIELGVASIEHLCTRCFEATHPGEVAI
jgi:hypothetical protein